MAGGGGWNVCPYKEEAIRKILTHKKVILEDFLIHPISPPPSLPPPHIVYVIRWWQSCVCVCVSSTIQRQGQGGPREPPRWVSGQGRPWPELLRLPQPSLAPWRVPPAWAVQCGMKFPGKQGARGTFEFTNGIKSIYIFMTTGKF